MVGTGTLESYQYRGQDEQNDDQDGKDERCPEGDPPCHRSLSPGTWGDAKDQGRHQGTRQQANHVFQYQDQGVVGLRGVRTRKMPTTTVGGMRAAATATPAIISEIFLEIARMVAMPREMAIPI